MRQTPTLGDKIGTSWEVLQGVELCVPGTSTKFMGLGKEEDVLGVIAEFARGVIILRGRGSGSGSYALFSVLTQRRRLAGEVFLSSWLKY